MMDEHGSGTHRHGHSSGGGDSDRDKKDRWPAYRVNSARALADLSNTLKLRLVRRYRSIEFSLPDKSPEQNEQLSSDINRLYRACGCGEGTLIAMVAVVGYAGGRVMESAAFQWMDLLTGLGYLFGGAIVGKVFGVWWSHIRLKQRLKRELASYKDPYGPPPTEEEMLCGVD